MQVTAMGLRNAQSDCPLKTVWTVSCQEQGSVGGEDKPLTMELLQK